MKVYLAGPMFNYSDKEFNHPAFFTAEKEWVQAGHEVSNPAADGHPDPKTQTRQDRIKFVKLGIIRMMACDAVAVLPGWRDGDTYAKPEVALAQTLDMPIYDAEHPRLLLPISETVLEEAERIVEGARQQTYGRPVDFFQLYSGYLKQFLGHEVTPFEAVMIMVLYKLARLQTSPDHRDTQVDIVGYMKCLAQVTGVEE